MPSKLSRTPSSTTTPTVGTSTTATTATTAEQEAALRARILAYGEEVEKALNSTVEDGKVGGVEEEEEDGAEEGETTAMPDANVKYAKLKVQLSEIQRAQAAQKRATKGKGDRKGTEPVSSEQERWMEAQVDVLKDKIQAVESDYTFRKVDAGAFASSPLSQGMGKLLTNSSFYPFGSTEKVYRAERTKLDAAQLAARLNGTTLETPFAAASSLGPSTPSDVSSGANGASVTPSAPFSEGATPSASGLTGANGSSSAPASPGRSANGAVEDKDDEGFFGTMLDEMPTEEINDEGTSIPVRNMALPKHFSGRTPRISLQDTVRKLDKHAKVTFAVISRSRAVRASVTIRWSPDESGAPGRVQYFDMQDVACWDQKQAYDYIATVALFAIATSPQGNGMALNKALPTVFRDLWDDFVAERTAQEEERYRERLKLYKSLAEPRCQEPPSRVRSRIPLQVGKRATR